jgi:hypothetical protein
MQAKKNVQRNKNVAADYENILKAGKDRQGDQ